MKKESLKTDHFRDFDSDMLPQEEASPRAERARKRKQAEKQVYTIAAVLLGIIFLISGITLLAVKAVRSAPEKEALVADAGETTDSVRHVVDSPVVLAATVDAVQGTQTDTVLEDSITQILSDMTIEDKVAGLFIVSPEQLTGVEVVTGFGDATKKALSERAVGGIVYSDKNLKTAEQLKEMLRGTQEASRYPVFLAVNENGEKRSAVATVLGEEVLASGSAIKDEEAATVFGDTVGAYLSLNGFNVNLAPVANLLPGEESGLDGFAYSQDATEAAAITGAVVTAMQEKNVTACVKYFPAYGEEITKTKEEMYGSELDPFRAAIEAGADAIMLSNCKAPAMTGNDAPSSMSAAVVSDLLRLELGFEGVIVTDALNAEAVITQYDAQESVLAALDAGADMLYMPLDFNASYEALLQAVKDGRVSEARLDESLRRVLRVKYK